MTLESSLNSRASRSRWLPVATGLLLVGVAGGSAFAGGEPLAVEKGGSETSLGFHVQRLATPTPIEHYAYTSLVTVTVPTGQWIFQGTVGLAGSSPSGAAVHGHIACEINNADTGDRLGAVQSSTWLTGEASSVTIPLQASGEFSAATEVEIACTSFGSGGASWRNGSGTSIQAIQVGALQHSEVYGP